MVRVPFILFYMNLEMSNELFIILYRFFRLRKVIFIASPGRRKQLTDTDRSINGFPCE